MKIQLLCDNPGSWIIPYAKELQQSLTKQHDAVFLFKHEEVTAGDVLVLLSCEKLFRQLSLNKHTLVVHESDLPKGKGWSPLTWQVLEGKKQIPVTLFEAAEQVDAGVIYEQVIIELNGAELVDELREKQGKATQQLVEQFVAKYPNNIGKEQSGESTFYPRRKPEDSQLDITKSIDEQFNLLRVCDNERYPAYFEKDGTRYIVKIYKQ